jgi:hypothetical protein
MDGPSIVGSREMVCGEYLSGHRSCAFGSEIIKIDLPEFCQKKSFLSFRIRVELIKPL